MRASAPESGGILPVDKPSGMTSHDVVAAARRALGIRRVGHAGTLDPYATGLLVLLVGSATRLLRFLDTEPKVYEALIRFGSETDTDDVTGVTTRTAQLPSVEAVAAGIRSLTGEILQTPPSYSAKSVGGRRAHAAARAGQPLDLAPSRVAVHEWKAGRLDGNDLPATITCSGGTYVRALARDLGRLAGSAAHLASLRRISSGRFSADTAFTLEQLARGETRMIAPADALSGVAVINIDAGAADRVLHGVPVEARAAGETAALVDPDGRLIAIAERDGEKWQPRVVLGA